MPAMFKAASLLFSLLQLAPIVMLSLRSRAPKGFPCATRGETEMAGSLFVNVAHRNTPHHESLPS
jgi:hypothetical protein